MTGMTGSLQPNRNTQRESHEIIQQNVIVMTANSKDLCEIPRMGQCNVVPKSNSMNLCRTPPWDSEQQECV